MGSRAPGRPLGELGIPPEEAADPASLGAFMLRFLQDLQVRQTSQTSVRSRGDSLRWFLAWCKDRGLSRPQEITRPILQRYQRHLFYYRKKDGAPLSLGSQMLRLAVLKGWFRWMTRQNLLLYNPASELELPRAGHRLPKHVLTVAEAEAVLAVPDLSQPVGLRDRAVLEVFYSTGMRRMELARLKLFDLDQDRLTVMIRQGKGGKDRMVPIGERAVAWVRKYLEEVRPGWVMEPDPGWLFLREEGDVLAPNMLTQRVGDYVAQAGIQKQGSCHLFRHTMATLMLENGADVRFIQEMLGHSDLKTTQLYTRVSIRKLQEIHAATHPGARLTRSGSAPGEAPENPEGI